MKAADNRPRKRFGQHFLHDKNIIDKIIQAIHPQPDTPIVEIGPGRGALTLPLLEQTQTLHVVEIDKDLAYLLRQVQHCTAQLKVHQADALAFDFTTLHREKIQIIGNLPYQISSPLLFHLLEQKAAIKEMIFMLQKELVERICAGPDCRDYGRLSVMLQSQCRVTKLFSVAAQAFTPAPKVDSAMLRLVPNDARAKAIGKPRLFAEIVKRAFNYRRKTLRNALRGLVDEAHFEQAGIAPGARAEKLSVQDFILLTNTVPMSTNKSSCA